MIRWTFIIMFFLTVPLVLLHFAEGNIFKGMIGVGLLGATALLIDYWGAHE